MKEIDNNDEDEKEQFTIEIRQVVIETKINTKLNNQTIKIREYKIKLMTNFVEVSVTNVIIFKIVYSNFFFKKLIKTRIFI